MLGLKKFVAGAALTVAVFGISGIRSAGAVPVTFVFDGVCNDCADFGGAGTNVRGTLALDVGALVDGELIENTEIVSFTLQFDHNVPDGTFNQAISFVPGFFVPDLFAGAPYAPNQTIAGNVGNIFVDGDGDFAIENLTFWDSQFSALTMTEQDAITDTWASFPPFPQLPNNYFDYHAAEPVVNSAWTLTGSGQSIPPGDGNGTASFGFKQAIPEPGSALTFLLGTVGLLALARRRRISAMTNR